jgi:ribose transport system substrate-binding protein
VNKLQFHKEPPRVDDATPLTAVTKENVEAFAKNWEKWLPKP